MLLINPSEVVKYAFNSSELLKTDLIRETKIDIAQEMFVRPKVGNEIFEKLTAGELQNFTHDFIKPALAYYVRYLLIEELTVKLGDDGAIVYTGGKVEEVASNTFNQTDKANKETIDNAQEIKKSDSKSTSQTDASEIYAEDKTSTENASRKEIATNAVAKTETHKIDKDSTTVNTTINENSLDESFAGADTDIDNTKTDKIETVANNVKKVDTEKTISQNQNQNATNTLEKLINQTQNDTTNRVQNNSNQKSTKNFTSAERFMIHRLQVRAIGDAYILMKKALLYIKKNPDVFGTRSCKNDPFVF